MGLRLKITCSLSGAAGWAAKRNAYWKHFVCYVRRLKGLKGLLDDKVDAERIEETHLQRDVGMWAFHVDVDAYDRNVRHGESACSMRKGETDAISWNEGGKVHGECMAVGR